MGWHINEVENTLTLTRNQAIELMERGSDYIEHACAEGDGKFKRLVGRRTFEVI